MTSPEQSAERQRLIDDVRSRANLTELVGRDVRLKKRGRDHWACCPFHSERTPSFKVSEGGGFYHCFGCGAHGSAFDWIMQRRGVSFPEALQELAELVGLADPLDGSARRPEMLPVAERKSRAEIEQEDRDAIAYARSIWDSGQLIEGTRAEAYLRRRGIRMPLPPTLKYHPALRYSYEAEGDRFEVHGVYPAMLAPVQGRDGHVIGVHRTYLAPAGPPRKADDLPLIDGKRLKAKKMAGRCWSGAIRLCACAPRLGAAEGIETALSVIQPSGRPVWAAGSMGNMAEMALPDQVRQIDLYTDGDSDPEAMANMVEKAARFYGGQGRKMMRVPAPPGFDFNDVLMGRAG